MFLNKEVSPISLGRTTQFLDANYGLPTTRTLIILFLLARRKEKKGQNMAILQLGLIIFDLLMDILFVITNARVVDWLYIPKFLEWFSQNGKVASTFTLLAGADIEGACLSVCLEDIPQLFIQRNTINYDIIPLFTLISSKEPELKGKINKGSDVPIPEPSVGKINDVNDEHKVVIKDDQFKACIFNILRQ
ncbi:4448_t:CDS:2 [Funneliformis mosseae]|uniref:4448_t:CDS:1 n=1 Tax=Funneliformis mosseae TaxID=27381 RepID=A0A9N9GFW5_FUNMO|nr:4448_t:CDS:2 [Funneliformis mosseae]